MSQNTSTPTHTQRIRGQTFQALTNPLYRRLWLAAWLWYISRMMDMVVLSWLVLEMTDSPMMVALVGASRMLPMLLLGLVAGSLADRFSKKRVMVASQVLNVVVALSMTLLIFTDVIQPWHTFLASFLTGVVSTADFSTRRAFFSEIFDETSLVNAVSLDAVAMTGSGLVGPILGGSLISLAGFEGAYTMMVGALLVGFVLLVSLRTTKVARSSAPAASVATQVVEAVRIIRTNRTIWAVVVLTVAFNFFAAPFLQMVPVIARDVLGVGSVLYGVLAAATGLGATTGSIIIATLGARRPGTVLSLGAILMLTGIFFFALSTLYPLSFVLLFVAGLGMSGFATMQVAMVLRAAPPEMRGRAVGAVALGIGSAPLGVVMVGQLAEALGAQVALALLTGTGFLVLNVLRWRLPVLRDREA